MHAEFANVCYKQPKLKAHRDEFDEATFTVTRATLKTLTTLDHELFCYEHSAAFYTEKCSTYIYLNKPF